jgi:hypothetical protein
MIMQYYRQSIFCKQKIDCQKIDWRGFVQHGVLQYWGRSNTHGHWFAIGLRFGQKFFNVAFCSYLYLQYFNWAAVPGGRISNPPTSQSPIVGCKQDAVSVI